MQIDSILKLHYRQFLELAVSPDDLSVLVVFGNDDMPHEQYAYDERNRSIWKSRLDEDEISMLVSCEEDAHGPSWSTDGTHIAYISRVSGRPEIWVMKSDGSQKGQVTQLDCFTGRDALNGTRLLWSADDTFIVFNAVPYGGLYGIWQDTEKADKALLGQFISVSSKSSRNDSFARALSVYEGALCTLDLHSGEITTLVSQKGTGFKLIDWLPDDEHFVYSVGTEIESVNVRSRERQTVCSDLTEPYLVKVVGDHIRVASSTQEEIQIGHVIDGALHVVSKVSIPGFEIQLHSWNDDASMLFISSTKGVSNILYVVDAATGHVEQLTEEAHVVFRYENRCGVHALHSRNSAVFPYGSPNAANELWKWDEHTQHQLRRVSNFNGELAAERMPTCSVIHYQSGAAMIEAILVLPPDYSSDKAFPTLVYLHGGPESHVNASFTELISARAGSADSPRNPWVCRLAS